MGTFFFTKSNIINYKVYRVESSGTHLFNFLSICH